MEKYEFYIAGRARNKDYILKICDLFDKYNILEEINQKVVEHQNEK